MGCSTCGKKAVYAPPQTMRVFTAREIQNTINPNCPYTMEQMRAWANLLICFKEKGFYVSYNITARTINKSLGIVLSALNYPTNICYFESDLQSIFDIVTVIVNSEKC